MYDNSCPKATKGASGAAECTGIVSSATGSFVPSSVLSTSTREESAADAHASSTTSRTNSSCSLHLSETVAGPGDSDVMTLTGRSSSGTHHAPPLPLNNHDFATAATAPSAGEASANPAATTPPLRSCHEPPPRYPSLTQSAELGLMATDITPDASTQSLQLRLLSLASNTANDAYPHRYANITSDSTVFSPHSVSSVVRSGQCATQNTSQADELTPSSSVAAGAGDLATLFEVSSPQKRARGGGHSRDGYTRSDPPPRYPTQLSSSRSCGDLVPASLSDWEDGNSVQVHSPPATGARLDTPLSCVPQSGSPRVLMSSDASLCFGAPRNQHRKSLPVANAAGVRGMRTSDSRESGGAVGNSTTADTNDEPLLVSSSSVLLQRRRGDDHSPHACLASRAPADDDCGPTCGDSTTAFTDTPAMTTSIPRPPAHPPRESSPQVEMSPEADSVDLTRMPIRGDMRIRILGRGADDFLDEDDPDMDDETRDRLLQEKVQRMYGRILTAYKNTATGDLTPESPSEPRGVAKAKVDDDDGGDAPREVVARSPHLPPASQSPLQRAPRFTTREGSAPASMASPESHRLSKTTSGLTTITIESPFAHRRHVTFDLPSDNATPSTSRSGSPLLPRVTISPPKRRLRSPLPPPPLLDSCTSDELDQDDQGGSASTTPHAPDTTARRTEVSSSASRNAHPRATSPVALKGATASTSCPRSLTMGFATNVSVVDDVVVVSTTSLSTHHHHTPAVPNVTISATPSPIADVQVAELTPHSPQTPASTASATTSMNVRPRPTPLHSEQICAPREPKPPLTGHPFRRASTGSTPVHTTSRTGAGRCEVTLPRLGPSPTTTNQPKNPTVPTSDRKHSLPSSNNVSHTSSLPSLTTSRGEKSRGKR